MKQSELHITVSEAAKELAKGAMVIVTDDQERENEGDLMILADKVTPEAINFMASHARGLICLTVRKRLADHLGIFPMVPASSNQSRHHTQFMVSIEAREGVTTGISAYDRSHTIQVAVNPMSNHTSIVSPGHIFPLLAQEGGVLVRAGHTEAGCDLADLAKSPEPASVICEILDDDGTMAHGDTLHTFARRHSLPIVTIQQIISERIKTETTIEKIKEELIVCPFGSFKMITFRDCLTQTIHLALTKGVIDEKPTLVRVHVAHFAQDCLFIGEKDFNPDKGSLHRSLQALSQHDGGSVLVCIMDSPHNTWYHEPHAPTNKNTEKQFGIGSQILRSLGVRTMNILGSEKNYPGISAFQLKINKYIQF